jgi:dipeptidase D
VEIPASYSAWQYRPDSHLRDVMVEAFRAVYGEEPRIAALHAGLECGILSGKMPDLDCISFGPDLTNIHTPRERLHIASTERTWKLTLETLKRLK